MRNIGPWLMKIRRIWLTAFIILLFGVVLTFALHAVFQSNILGADFFTRWIGGRALLRDGLNPYSQEATLLSQQGIYGRPALPTEDQVAFAYPPYILLVMLPTLFFGFDWAQAGWLAFNILALTICLMTTFRKSPVWMPISFVFFYPLALGLILGNFSTIIAAIWLALFSSFFASKKIPSNQIQWLIGVLLAYSTIKPQLTWFLILFGIVLAIHKKLWRIIISFTLSILILFAISWLLVPTWVTDWLNAIYAYSQYTNTGQPYFTLINWMIPTAHFSYQWLLTAVLMLLTLVGLTLAFLNKIRWSTIFLWGSAVTYLIHPNGMAYEQVIFYLPFAAWIFTRSHQKRTLNIVMWIGAWFLSWLCFALGRFIYYPFDVLPVLFFIIWAIVISFQKHNNDIFSMR